MELTDFGLKIGAALLSGLFIGLEREFQKKHAGLKTNALVSLGAAIYVLASLHFEGEAYVDTTRVMGQVVTGIGFLCAGVILHKGATIQGLTTAATVWCSAAAGCIAAIGAYWELLLLTGLIVFVNVFFGLIDRFINKKITKEKDDMEES